MEEINLLTDLEDIMIPAILGLIVGPAGTFFLFQLVASTVTSNWTFTMHDLAARLLPTIPWLWLVNCIFIASYMFWRNN